MLQHVQGDSYGENFTSKDVPTFDANWGGTWAIVSAPGATPAASGTITRSADNTALELRVAPGATDNAPEGDYLLVTKISNSSIGFRKTFQKSFQIVKKGA